MASVSVARLLGGQVPVGSAVTVQGWVRTRRDSKAGLSFIHVHDGSAFEPIQVVAPGELPNYASEIAKLSAGCAVSVEGTLVSSQGKGQAVEIAAVSITVVGWVDDPRPTPSSKASHDGVPARGRAPAPAHEHAGRAHARASLPLAAIHRFFHDEGFFWIHTPIITASDAEGAGQMFRVSTLDLGESIQHCAHARGQGRLRA